MEIPGISEAWYFDLKVGIEMKIMFDDYFCFFQYFWTATKGRNAGFKKVIIEFSSNYDIITINCNTIII